VLVIATYYRGGVVRSGTVGQWQFYRFVF